MNPDNMSESESVAGSMAQKRIYPQDSESKKGVTEEVQTPGGKAQINFTGRDIISDVGTEHEFKVSDNEKDGKQRKGFEPFSSRRNSQN